MKRIGMSCIGLVLAALAFPQAPAAGQTRLTSTEAPDVIAVFRVHGEIEESPPSMEFSFSGQERRTLYDWIERLRKAKKDPRVKAVVLVFDKPRLGLAQIQELRSALRELRAAEKDVYAYLEEAHTGTYLLASGASRIVMVPTGDLYLTGINVEQAYFKNLMDKIGLEADIEHVGDYKAAGEPFTRTGPTPEAKQMLESLVNDIFDQLVEAIADARQLDAAQVRKLIDQAPLSAKQALEARLVDELTYAEDFTQSLRERYGENAKFDHDYGRKKGPELDFSSIFTFFKTFGELMSKARSADKTSIAVVYVDGMIVTGKKEEGLFGDSGTAASTTLRRTIAKAAEDDTVKAVVLRVDSPGGSALASEIIWHATQELKGNKPLIVSMGNVAASGGYYVSAGAATIFADPGTITGSIGVVGGKLVTRGLWDWIGITFDKTKKGQNADLFSGDEKFTEQQRAIIRRMMQQVYEEFKDRVKQGRGDRLKKDLEEIAGGRVWTGRQAQSHGLVDKLGGLHDAIQFAAAQANISDYEIRQMPEPRNFFDALVESLTGESQEKDVPQIAVGGAGMAGWTREAPFLRDLLPLLRKADPARFELVVRSLLRIELLGREGVLLVTPAEIEVR